MSLEKYASAAERSAATALIDELLKRGFTVRVHEGGDWASDLSTDRDHLLGSMASTGEDRVHAYEVKGPVHRCVMNFALLYQGSEERDEVIYDYGSASDHAATAEAIWQIAGGQS
jgi:hypothetical protein